MTKTSLDVITAAYRRLGVAAEDTPISGEQRDIGFETLSALVDELSESEGVWGLNNIEAIPARFFLPLSQMLAVELGPNYAADGRSATWWQGFRRLRRVAFPDDRLPVDRSAAGKRAQFY